MYESSDGQLSLSSFFDAQGNVLNHSIILDRDGDLNPEVVNFIRKSNIESYSPTSDIVKYYYVLKLKRIFPNSSDTSLFVHLNKG